MLPSPRPRIALRPDIETVYDEVLQHYNSCTDDPTNISDTWAHTLEQKGRVYELDELLTMHTPGSRVCSWIRELDYFCDETVLDFNDPIQMRLLAAGEPDFGCPRQEVRIGDVFHSSLFLNAIPIAATVIRQLEATNVERPHIVEIGGGLGYFQFHLRSYYGDRATIYAVDLPETLLIQEWYLRNCYPGAPTVYKASQANVAMAEGGLNFVNAYVFTTLEIQADAVVNIDSFHEMRASTVASYVGHAERILHPGGLLYQRNGFGHSSDSAPEPSEYAADAGWRIIDAGFLLQPDTCSHLEQLWTMMVRAPGLRDPETRRLLLRAIWNGYLTGRLGRTGDILRRLLALQDERPEDVLGKAAAVMAEDGRPWVRLSTLALEVLLPPSEFSVSTGYRHLAARPEQPVGDRCMSAVWLVQTGLLEILAKPAQKADIPVQVERLVRDFEGTIGGPPASAFWTAFTAAVALPLGRRGAAVDWLAAIGMTTPHANWLVRFAHLLTEFGHGESGLALVERALALGGFDVASGFKLAELLVKNGQGSRAQTIFAKHMAGLDRNPLMMAVAGKTAARIGLDGMVSDICRELLASSAATALATAIDVMVLAVETDPACYRGVVEAALPRLEDASASPALLTATGELLCLAGFEERGTPLLEAAAERFRGQYFEMAGLGRVLMGLGRTQDALDCLDRSLALRPDSFLHRDYIGTVLFGAGHYDRAATLLDSAAAEKPYLRQITARALFSRLPAEMRNGKLPFAPRYISLIFQRQPRFYHDIGPKPK